MSKVLPYPQNCIVYVSTLPTAIPQVQQPSGNSLLCGLGGNKSLPSNLVLKLKEGRKKKMNSTLSWRAHCRRTKSINYTSVYISLIICSIKPRNMKFDVCKSCKMLQVFCKQKALLFPRESDQSGFLAWTVWSTEFNHFSKHEEIECIKPRWSGLSPSVNN